MSIHTHAYFELKKELAEKAVQLVAVSKTKPAEDILQLYKLGQVDFGENYVQELVEKAAQLPPDIHWHFIGHLQTNKVKLIVPFVQLIQGVDSLKLLTEINKQAGSVNRVIDCLLQVHIAQEETKFGMDEEELQTVINASVGLQNIRIMGLMGMASLTEDTTRVRAEFKKLKQIFERLRQSQIIPKGVPGTNVAEKGPSEKLQILSMGMTGDYRIAIEEGATMVRVGSLLFGERS